VRLPGRDVHCKSGLRPTAAWHTSYRRVLILCLENGWRRALPFWFCTRLPDKHRCMIGGLVAAQALLYRINEEYLEKVPVFTDTTRHDVLSLGVGSGKTAQDELSAKRTSKA
jgi:hypothetical protein